MNEQAPKKLNKQKLVTILSVVVSIGLLAYFAYDWMIEKNKITVTGNSYAVEKNQVATFYASVSALNSDRAEATRLMNEKATTIMNSIGEFGLPEEDVKTTNINVYQEQNWDPVTQKTVYGDWRATVSVEVKLDDANRASEMAALLSNLEVTDFYGPNFQVDDKNLDEATLLAQALEDARTKAEAIAKASNRRLGRMISFHETGGYYDGMDVMYMERGMGGGGAPIAPGGTEVQKSITATFIMW